MLVLKSSCIKIKAEYFSDFISQAKNILFFFFLIATSFSVGFLKIIALPGKKLSHFRLPLIPLFDSAHSAPSKCFLPITQELPTFGNQLAPNAPEVDKFKPRHGLCLSKINSKCILMYTIHDLRMAVGCLFVMSLAPFAIFAG